MNQVSMNTMSKLGLGMGCFLILLIGSTLYTSSDARNWVGMALVPSEVRNARPLPPVKIPPKDPSTAYLQFIAVGDAGTGDSGQKQVASSMAAKASTDSADFVLVLGDNFYENGVTSVSDNQWKTKFEDIYSQPSLQVPFYAVLGNHDYRGNPQAEVEYTALSQRWKMPSRYYMFSRTVDDSTEISFLCLDTQPMAYLSPDDVKSGKDSATYMPQLRWLEQTLSQSKARWKFALGHHPLYSNGQHGNNRTLASLLEPVFKRYKLDFYLAGHDHDQQLLQPVNGVHYIISGGGGKDRDTEWASNTIYAGTNLGFTWFRVSHRDVVVEFLNRDGVVEFVQLFARTPLPHKR